MANNNYIETFDSKMDWANVFVRTGDFPLDRSSIFSSYDDAVLYASGTGKDSRGLGKTSYIGQIITVYKEGKVDVYKIGENRNLEHISDEDDIAVIINSMSIVKGDADKSAVLKGENNQAISEGGVALGKDNFVGLKGWYYKAIQFNTTSGITFLYLSKTQQVPVKVTQSSDVEQEKDIDFTLILNDVVSVVNDSKYDNKYKISTNEISTYGRIGIKSVDSNTPFPFDGVKTDDELNNGIFDPEDYSIYCLSKPDVGIADMGQDSFVSGYKNKATNGKATSFGYENHAYGKFSFVEGRGNEAGYAAHAEGRETHATGDQSHSEGRNTWATGDVSHAEGSSSGAAGNYSHAEGGSTHAYGAASHSEGLGTKANTKASHAEGDGTSATGIGSHAEGVKTTTLKDAAHAEGAETSAEEWATHAEGYATKAVGYGSHTEGDHTIANNAYEHASGRYNKSTKSADKSQATRFSIGIGTSDTDRKNAFEVKQNGDIYVEGVDGTVQNKLAELSQKDEQTDAKLAELSVEVNEVVKKIDNINPTPMISVTYAELVNLRDNGELIAGMQYRITDYVTTTAQENTRSAGHQFDVIVTADDEKTLNEKAKAIQHEGDTYFSDSNLATWEIWYSLDNDSTRFAWADADNGKGVIYYMKDEWNNECPYDFKNIIFLVLSTFKCQQYGMEHTYLKNGNLITIGGVDYYGYTRIVTGSDPPPPPEILYVTDDVLSLETQFYTIEDNVSSIYTLATITAFENKNGQYFTFNSAGKDGSVGGFSIFCYSNIINRYVENGKIKLNAIVFENAYDCNNNIFGGNCYNNIFGNSCYNNIFGDNCNNNTFSSGCYNNSFGHNCYNNIFGGNFDNNIFGVNCYNNIFGSQCYNNRFGGNCNNNTFGVHCTGNILGNDCYRNTFGDNYISNILGNDCNNNSFSNNYCNNSFGNFCNSNSFGNNCGYNSFGNNCGYNSFGNNCYSNSFANSCFYNSFGNNCNYNSFGNMCAYNTFRDADGYEFNEDEDALLSVDDLIDCCRNIHFGDGCTNIILVSTKDSVQWLQNINIAQGLSSTEKVEIEGWGEYDKPVIVHIDVIDQPYEIRISRNTKSEIKIYCVGVTDADDIQTYLNSLESRIAELEETSFQIKINTEE